MTRAGLRAAVFFLLLANPRLMATIPPFSFEDIPTFGGAISVAQGINDAGQVVGFARHAAVSTTGFIYQDGQLTNLGGLGSNPPFGSTDSDARAINSSGQVVGISEPTTSSPSHAFLYQNGSMQDLGTNGENRSIAEDINEDGAIAGWTLSGRQSAFVWEGGNFRELQSIAGNNQFSIARAINDKGTVAGYSDAAAPDFLLDRKATLWRGDEIIDLGKLSTSHSGSFAFDVNENDIVVGRSGFEPFVWTESNGMVGLPLLGGDRGDAVAINNGGLIVGYASLADGTSVATLWRDGVAYNLNNFAAVLPGWRLSSAADINEAGQIVGTAISPDGNARGFLLTPIPEPSMLSFTLILIFPVLHRGRRRTE